MMIVMSLCFALQLNYMLHILYQTVNIRLLVNNLLCLQDYFSFLFTIFDAAAEAAELADQENLQRSKGVVVDVILAVISNLFFLKTAFH